MLTLTHHQDSFSFFQLSQSRNLHPTIIQEVTIIRSFSSRLFQFSFAPLFLTTSCLYSFSQTHLTT